LTKKNKKRKLKDHYKWNL